MALAQLFGQQDQIGLYVHPRRDVHSKTLSYVSVPGTQISTQFIM